MAAESSQRLKLFSQSVFPAAASEDYISSSPALNLTATVQDGNVLCLRRDNGQLVSSHTEHGQDVRALRWKADGQFLAVGWADGAVRLMGVENTKAVHRIPVADGASPEITYIAWARNLTGRRHFAKAKAAASTLHGLLADLDLDLDLDLDKKEDKLDLPHELTFLEIDTALPKISPLPVSGGTGDDMFVFSTVASLDFLFRPLSPEENDTVDVMVVGTNDGGIHLSIYDSFVIGKFQYALNQGPAQRQSLQLCLHASHPEVSTHALLFQSSNGEDKTMLYLVPMDLRFVSYSPVNLSLLASKTTTLQKLLRYIKQTQIHMVLEWKSTRDLPSRFISNLQEELEKPENGSRTVVQELYHTVVTGHVHGPVKEWLTDSLAERGHKRWDKAVLSGLENLRDLVHQNMLPALDRCALILSRLLGLARFHESGEDIGFTSTQISQLVDTLSGLSLACNKILLAVMQELDLFRVFSCWLRLEIDRQTSSSTADELSEKEATMEHAKVLAYIQKYLLSSPLSLFLDSADRTDYENDRDKLDKGTSVLDELDKQFQRAEAGQTHMKALTKTDFLVEYLSSRAEKVFSNIAEAEKRSVRFGQPVTLRLAGETIIRYDMRMSAVSKPDGVDGVIYTAVSSEEHESDVHILRTSVEVINGISNVLSTEICTLDLGKLDKGRLAAFKFLDDKTLLALWYPQGKPDVLIRIPYRSDKLAYAPYQRDGLAVTSHQADNLAFVKSLDTYILPEDNSFVPANMEVKEAYGGDTPARVCLLDSDGVRYKVFELPADEHEKPRR